jgi:hypothetical protein
LILVIFETVIATLAGTYIGPQSNVNCRLQDRWRELFRRKDARIRTIQDSLNCCGLLSTKDMAFPFPAAGLENNVCEKTYRRSQSCFEPWRAEEQKIAAILLVVDILVVLWQVVVLFGRSPETPSWLARAFRGRWMGDDPERQTRRAIDYRRVEGRYLDNPEEHDDDDVQEDATTGPRVIGDASTRTEDFASRVQPSQLHDSQEQWAERA